MPEQTLTGVGVSPGVGAGAVLRAPARPPEPGTRRSPGAHADEIRPAAERVAAELAAHADTAPGDAAFVLAQAALMATDEELLAAAYDLALADGVPAHAVWTAATSLADSLRERGPGWADRVWEVLEVRDRIVAVLLARDLPAPVDPGHPYVLVATDLSPVDVALLDPERALAVVTMRGGPLSRTGAVARAKGIPAVVGVRDATRLAEGASVVVDGEAGTVVVAPLAPSGPVPA